MLEQKRETLKLLHGATPPKAIYLIPEPDIVETNILPNPNAARDSKELQSRIAKLLSRFDEPYAERALHFSWLQNDPYFQQIRGRVSGWSGVVKDVKQTPGGGWIATIRVSPRIYPESRAILLDYVEETYRFQNGNLTRIASRRAREETRQKTSFCPILSGLSQKFNHAFFSPLIARNFEWEIWEI